MNSRMENSSVLIKLSFRLWTSALTSSRFFLFETTAARIITPVSCTIMLFDHIQHDKRASKGQSKKRCNKEVICTWLRCWKNVSAG